MSDRQNKRQRGLALITIGLLSLLPLSLQAQDVTQWRGGWMADVAGVHHVLYLVLRDGKVSGFHCADCYAPDQLSFVDDGTLDSKGLHFKLYHSADSQTPYVEQVDATLANGELKLTVQKPQAAPVQLVMKRSAPREPAPVNLTPNLPAGGGPRVLPSPAEVITADKLLGLWLWGIGPGKQYFIFRRHKQGVRGMVCGPCENPKDFAPLEGISMNGTKLHFDIVHEDNGGGYEQHGPFNNVTDAVLSMNELHMTTAASFDPNGRKIDMSLLGPVRYQSKEKP